MFEPTAAPSARSRTSRKVAAVLCAVAAVALVVASRQSQSAVSSAKALDVHPNDPSSDGNDPASKHGDNKGDAHGGHPECTTYKAETPCTSNAICRWNDKTSACSVHLKAPTTSSECKDGKCRQAGAGNGGDRKSVV